MSGLWRYIPELLDQPVPRYTSYPTAADFDDNFGSIDMVEALAAMPEDATLSLYVHIPYCREICWYCGCSTGAANREHRLNAYLERLRDEIGLVADALGGRGRVTRLAFGGGSPNAIRPQQFDAIVDTVAARLPLDEATTLSVEIDPRCFDRNWAAAIARNRVSRVSLGVQTFDDRVQAAIGRVQPYALIERAMMRLRAVGVASINFDLMYGLPFQDAAVLDQTIEQAIALSPERLAVFGYAHVPHLIPRQRRIDARALPDAQARFAMAELASTRLTDAGYAQVGFDHFAKPGDALAQAMKAGKLHRNFQGFTEDAADATIGIGASAISNFPDRLLQNDRNSGRWGVNIAAGRFAVNRGVRRSGDDRRRGAIIEQILAHGQADLAGLADLDMVKAWLARFHRLDLISWHGAKLMLAPNAWPYARTIAASFDRYRDSGEQRFSNAV